MDIVNEIIITYLVPALGAAILGLFTWIGTEIKKAYQRHVDTQTEKAVVDTVVKAVEQLYADLSGEERLKVALENASELLKEKGLTISSLELRLLIESAVQGLQHGLHEVKTDG